LQHIVYEKQLEIKKAMVQDVLRRLGHQKVEVLPVIGMEYPWRYRNKGHFQVEQEKGKLQLGFYRAGSYDFISAGGCVLFSSQINKLVSYLEELLSLQKVVVYHRRTGEGNLRNILIRESRDNREIMMVFITKEESLGFDQSILNNLTRIFPQVVSIYQNINKGYRSVLEGKDFRLLKGKVDLEDAIGPFRFKISPQSFFQVNVAQAQILNEKILEYSHLSGEETVIDSYCGTAAISIYLANYAKKVYGIEIEKSAIRDAKINSELNRIFNLKFFSGRVEEWLYRWRKRGEKAQIIIVDPPRKGCSLKTLKEIVKIKPEQVLYVSCNPATLARDLKYLTKDDYKLEKVLPIDMFPQTSHLECLAYLKR
jgi:23S rRNA (uracil1939-C5)-methyltransferase